MRWILGLCLVAQMIGRVTGSEFCRGSNSPSILYTLFQVMETQRWRLDVDILRLGKHGHCNVHSFTPGISIE